MIRCIGYSNGFAVGVDCGIMEINVFCLTAFYATVYMFDSSLIDKRMGVVNLYLNAGF